MDLKKLIEKIDSEYGEGTIMKLGNGAASGVERIPTGIASLDLALGGGVPRGRVIEIYGSESSGKTTLSSHIIASYQRQGGVAAFVDAEHAFDPEYAEKIGVDTKNLLVSQPDTGERALEITEALIRTNQVDVVVIDSVAALVPRAEIEGDMGDSHMGLQARLMSQALRKITGAVSKSNTTVIFINQIRMKIGVMFGNPETTTGGNALKYYSSIRIDMRVIGKITADKEVLGSKIRAKVVKNKVAPPFKVSEFDILYNEGISVVGDLVDTAVKKEVITRKGAYYKYQDENIGHGRDATIEHLKANTPLLEEIRAKIS